MKQIPEEMDLTLCIDGGGTKTEIMLLDRYLFLFSTSPFPKIAPLFCLCPLREREIRERERERVKINYQTITGKDSPFISAKTKKQQGAKGCSSAQATSTKSG